MFCRHKALPAELNPQQNVLSTSSHQSELFPNLSPHLFTSSITLAAPGCSRRQNKHLPWGQRTSETTPQILLLEPATQKILISAATSGLQHEEVIGTPPLLPLSCSSKTGKANRLGSPHLLRTSTQFPGTMHQTIQLSTGRAKICSLGVPHIPFRIVLLGKVSVSAFYCVFN